MKITIVMALRVTVANEAAKKDSDPGYAFGFGKHLELTPLFSSSANSITI